MEGARPGVDGHGVRRAEGVGELLLEGSHLLALGQPAAGEDRRGGSLLVWSEHGRGRRRRRGPSRDLLQPVPDLGEPCPVTGHAQTRVRSPPAGARSVPPIPRWRAGTPATRAKSGTSRVTTAPAATIAQRPIVTGATHTARAPTEAPSAYDDADRFPVGTRSSRCPPA